MDELVRVLLLDALREGLVRRRHGGAQAVGRVAAHGDLVVELAEVARGALGHGLGRVLALGERGRVLALLDGLELARVEVLLREDDGALAPRAPRVAAEVADVEDLVRVLDARDLRRGPRAGRGVPAGGEGPRVSAGAFPKGARAKGAPARHR